MRAQHEEGAAAPGQAAPALKDEAPGVTAEGIEAQAKLNKADSRCAPHAQQALRAIEGEIKAADAKRLSTAQARAALRSMTLNRIEADDGRPMYVATFHALTRSFRDLAEVEAWLAMVDGERGEASR